MDALFPTRFPYTIPAKRKTPSLYQRFSFGAGKGFAMYRRLRRLAPDV